MISLDKVLSAYSGKPGCACGCLGKYYYRKETQELGGKTRGYPVTEDEISDKQVIRILNIINNHFNEVEDFGNCYHFEASKKRVYTIHTIKS